MRLTRPHFHFVAGFELRASPERIWEQLARSDSYESWWPWLRDLSSDGLVTDGSTRGWLRAPLGYRVRFQVRITEADEPKRLVARVSGDVAGDAELLLTPNGSTTHVSITFQAEVRRPLLRILSRPAHRLLAWGHDWVLARAVRDFERHLGAG